MTAFLMSEPQQPLSILQDLITTVATDDSGTPCSVCLHTTIESLRPMTRVIDETFRSLRICGKARINPRLLANTDYPPHPDASSDYGNQRFTCALDADEHHPSQCNPSHRKVWRSSAVPPWTAAESSLVDVGGIMVVTKWIALSLAYDVSGDMHPPKLTPGITHRWTGVAGASKVWPRVQT